MTGLIKNPKEICYIVSARLGSQRCPNKMIRPFYQDKTLLDILFEKLKKTSHITCDNLYLSAYEQQIKDIGYKHNVQIFHRSKKSAESEGTPLTDIYEWHILPYKYCVLISACNPLLTVKTIDDFCFHFECGRDEGLFAVVARRNYFWNNQEECLTPLTEDVMNTKTVPVTYEAAHCLYASRMDLIPKGKFMGDFTKESPALLDIPENEVFDIDYEWQFELGQELYKKTIEIGAI